MADATAVNLEQLGATIRNQDDLEKDVGRQADQLLAEQAEERDQKRLEKATRVKAQLEAQLTRLNRQVNQAPNPYQATKLRHDIPPLEKQIENINQDLRQIQARIDVRQQEQKDLEDREVGSEVERTGNARRPGETQRDFLIRTGKITPFSRIGQDLPRASANLADVMLDAEKQEDGEQSEGDEDDENIAEAGIKSSDAQPSHRHLMKPGFAEDNQSVSSSTVDSNDEFAKDRPRKRRKLARGGLSRREKQSPSDKEPGNASQDEVVLDRNQMRDPVSELSDSESISSEIGFLGEGPDAMASKRKGKAKRDNDDGKMDLTGIDDGNERLYQARLQRWVVGRRAARNKAQRLKRGEEAEHVDTEMADSVVANFEHETTSVEDESANDGAEEWYLTHPTRPDAEFGGGFRIPGDIFPSLFDYQKTGVQWLWELYSQQVGGIVGDEMGLGKTIQVIALLAGLHYSKKYIRPTIVVAPATVMKQWVNEFHRWWPPLRVSILHSSGSGMLDVRNESRLDDELDAGRVLKSTYKAPAALKAARRIVNRAVQHGHVLVTTYSGLQSYAELLIPVNWGHAILDEGHKIRNPNTGITIYCKELQTPNRIILSGTPMQNNLTELWSLFDFIFPMRLGTLVNFRNQFEIPIKQGGYANASNLQVETALQCAETLKDTISPYLLQRWKSDVAADLPSKSEQVLFCKLTKPQREAYERFLASDDVKAIMGGRRRPLYGIDILRKICNHPDLQDHKLLSSRQGYQYGLGSKSGKMQVVRALLQLWKDTGHKTLLFAQHRIMLDILEPFVKTIDGLEYRRMDGNTSIKNRQDMVDEFNANLDLHVFLLTTKVGGLGVNLTGADRVIIYDPDWNPSTDVQARERAWRLGQKREVEIYRLMTAGTIEEKIYHRQLFKQFLTNKILKDPKQRQTFHMSSLSDLFSFGETTEGETETGGLFKGTETQAGNSHKNASFTDQERISNIRGISRLEAYRQEAESKSSSDMPLDPPHISNPTNADEPKSTLPKPKNHALESLLSQSGVHATLSHDAIISSSSASKVGPDPEIIAREARRVAAAAAAELVRAGQAARAVPVGTPTWTGTVGVAGRPDSPAQGSSSQLARGGSSTRGVSGRGGPSSRSVLANLSARQTGTLTPSGATPASGSDNGESATEGAAFLRLIQDFLLAHGGRAPTRMLIDRFNRMCTNERRTAEFKEMLRRIAFLVRSPNVRGNRGTGRAGRMARGAMDSGASEGRGVWILKKEFGGPDE